MLVAASIVAAMRPRGEPINPTPKLTATINDAVHLARLALADLAERASQEPMGLLFRL